MGQIIRRHSPVGWLGWLALRLLRGEEIKLNNEKGWIKMEMGCEAPVLRVTEPSEKLVQQDEMVEKFSHGDDEKVQDLPDNTHKSADIL